MVHNSDLDRTASLIRLYPSIFQNKKVLYVGAREDRFDYSEEFIKGNSKITVLEIYPENVKKLKQLSWLESVIEGDICTYTDLEKYDLIFWWHGPEHVTEQELKKVLPSLETIANEAVVLGCPWGYFPQDDIYGNMHEKHISHLDYTIFEEFGYAVECLGRKDVHGSNITAVKIIK